MRAEQKLAVRAHEVRTVLSGMSRRGPGVADRKLPPRSVVSGPGEGFESRETTRPSALRTGSIRGPV